MMDPDLPGTGAVMEMEASGLLVMVTGPMGAPEPERAREAVWVVSAGRGMVERNRGGRRKKGGNTQIFI